MLFYVVVIPTSFLFIWSQSGAVVRYNFTIERHASKIYTMSMFEQFGKMIFEACAYRVEEVEKNKLYRTTHTDAARREKWSRVVFVVKMLDDGAEFDCECGMFAHMGMLCGHALKASGCRTQKNKCYSFCFTQLVCGSEKS
jgi:hypothetical protein